KNQVPMTIPQTLDRPFFEAQRARFNALVDANQAMGPEAARLFLYLNKACFNGRWRVNARGHFNVPLGGYESIPIPNLHPYTAAFQDREFTCGDFQELKLTPDDFIYADPPYVDAADGYNTRAFTWSDQVRLAHWLAAHPGPVVASGQGPKVESLYRDLGFTVSNVPMARAINSDGTGRGAVEEMLATRTPTEKQI